MPRHLTRGHRNLHPDEGGLLEGDFLHHLPASRHVLDADHLDHEPHTQGPVSTEKMTFSFFFCSSVRSNFARHLARTVVPESSWLAARKRCHTRAFKRLRAQLSGQVGEQAVLTRILPKSQLRQFKFPDCPAAGAAGPADSQDPTAKQLMDPQQPS